MARVCRNGIRVIFTELKLFGQGKNMSLLEGTHALRRTPQGEAVAQKPELGLYMPLGHAFLCLRLTSPT